MIKSFSKNYLQVTPKYKFLIKNNNKQTNPENIQVL